MTEQQISKLNSYFDEQIALCYQRSKELFSDNRTDEANFEKVKANVYDIFRTILSVAVRTNKGNPDTVHHFFVQKLEQIPSGWAAAYDKAKQYDDTANMHIEQLKLETVDAIKENFAKIMEETA